MATRKKATKKAVKQPKKRSTAKDDQPAIIDDSAPLIGYAPHRVGFALARLTEGKPQSVVVALLKEQYGLSETQSYRYVAAAKGTLESTLTIRRDVHRQMQRGTLWGIVLDAVHRAQVMESGREWAAVIAQAVSALADLRKLDKLDFDPAHDLVEGQELEDPETVRLVVEILEGMRSKAPDLVDPYLARIQALAG